MPRMKTVLEDCVRYRDSKKWKRRYCILSRPDSKKKTVEMFITKDFGVNTCNQEIDDKSRRHFLIDEITGFEHGRHVDKESHVVALIGCNVVYCVAFDQTDTMFRWAETLSKILSSVNFHVTLKKVSETSGLFNKITVGIQGNLHVQESRLCLIGEPADGNKFICEWSITNLISIYIYDTTCDKIKKLQIKSNGKTNKGKGNFDFEISLTQKSVFEDTFRTFLISCKECNPEFKTNFLLKSDSCDIASENSYSYSIICNDKTHSTSENSSSLEKRSSEIPIPRSREHSGPDQRPIENVQIKIRKSHKNLQKVKNELHKHFSVIETIAKHDHDVCLFADDEEIEEQVHHKSQNLLCRGLSQESSGVYINGPSDSMRDTELFIQDDSGIGIVPSNLLQSTSSGAHHDMCDQNVIAQCGKKLFNSKHRLFLTFYRNICRCPLSLNNYTNYYRLLRTVADKRQQLMRRSNSFNCVHWPEMKKYEYCRKYSHTNYPLNVTNKVTERHFMNWKDKMNNESMEDSFLYMHLEGDEYEDHDVGSKLLISKRLPFRSMRDFNCSMIGSLQSGTVCFSLFAYHHFLTLMKDVRSAMKNIDSKVTITEIGSEYKSLKERISRKNKSFNHWLENVHSYSRLYDPDVTQPSIIDINIMLAIEIADTILYSKSGSNQEFCDIIPRQKSYFDTNPTIELNDDKFQLSDTTDSHLSPDLSAESSIYLESPRPVLCMSCSTPDFHHYSHHHHHNERAHKLSNIETAYQNISSNDTFQAMNHTFPKQTNADSSHHKEGSFKRFRRKCSPNIFIPFIRRKTSSTYSTVSEPTCHNDNKEQNSYYNITNQRDIHSKKSLSVVLDSQPYVNMKQAPNYINLSQKSGGPLSTNSSNYINTDPPMYDDDDTPYPDEIIDPSRNYGDLNFIKSRLRYTRYDHDSLGFRRASFSILSPNSIDLFKKRAYSSISRVHSDACNHSSNYRSIDCLGSSPQSLLSCCHCRHLPPPLPLPPLPSLPPPQSLNYITVVESQPCNTLPNKVTKPLSIFTDTIEPHSHYHQHHQHYNNNTNTTQPYRARNTWLSPQSSPIVDYCQIDLNCTYALRDIDQKLYNKLKLRDRQSLKNTNNRSPDDVDSFKSFEQMSDNHSMGSLSLLKERKSSHKKNSFRQLFSRKSDWLS